MKTIFRYIFVASTILSVTACEESLDIWDSNTLTYSGTYFWELFNEDMSEKLTTYDVDRQILIYNTAENQTNNIWIEDTDGVFPLKSKFNLSGDASAFKSSETAFEDLTNNLNAIEAPDAKKIVPEAASELLTQDREYIRAIVLDGKILPNAGTTVTGNPVDSLYVKVKLYSGSVTFESYLVPEELRESADEKYKWRYKSVSYDDSKDQTYVISGHRKTGFSKDDHRSN